jgi:GntR family transcriptional regulator
LSALTAPPEIFTIHRFIPLYIALGRVLCILAGQERSMLHRVADVPQWDPDAGGPAYVYMRVADHIAARIAAGDLPAEARLPAERDLAAEYAVAIGTARRAVLELRDRGLVVTLPGKGTYVVSPGGQPKI